jgi:hypothetical protein
MVRTMPCHGGVRLRCSDRPPVQHPPKEDRPSTTPLDDNRPPPGADSAVTSVPRPSSAGRVCLWSAVCRACCEPTHVRDHRSSRDCPRRDTAPDRAARRRVRRLHRGLYRLRPHGVELRACQVADADQGTGESCQVASKCHVRAETMTPRDTCLTLANVTSSTAALRNAGRTSRTAHPSRLRVPREGRTPSHGEPRGAPRGEPREIATADPSPPARRR